MNKPYDKIKYNKGDKVRRKNRETEEDEKCRTVLEVQLLNNLNNFSYYILFFEDEPKSPYVSAEFEPFDEQERKEYYEHWNNTLNKPKGKTKAKKKTTDKKIFKMK